MEQIPERPINPPEPTREEALADDVATDVAQALRGVPNLTQDMIEMLAQQAGEMALDYLRERLEADECMREDREEERWSDDTVEPF